MEIDARSIPGQGWGALLCVSLMVMLIGSFIIISSVSRQVNMTLYWSELVVVLVITFVLLGVSYFEYSKVEPFKKQQRVEKASVLEQSLKA